MTRDKHGLGSALGSTKTLSLNSTHRIMARDVIGLGSALGSTKTLSLHSQFHQPQGDDLGAPKSPQADSAARTLCGGILSTREPVQVKILWGPL